MTATKNTTRALRIGMNYVINVGLPTQKAVEAFSPKQATFLFCKGGQSRGGQVVTLDGVRHEENSEVAVSWKRYNQLLNVLENAPIVKEVFNPTHTSIHDQV